MSTTTGGGEFGNPLRKFKLVFLGEQSGKLGKKTPRLSVLFGLMLEKEVANIDVAN